MHEQWVHLLVGLLRSEEENLSSDISENLDRLYNYILYISGMFVCYLKFISIHLFTFFFIFLSISFTDELLVSCNKSQYLFLLNSFR